MQTLQLPTTSCHSSRGNRNSSRGKTAPPPEHPDRKRQEPNPRRVITAEVVGGSRCPTGSPKPEVLAETSGRGTPGTAGAKPKPEVLTGSERLPKTEGCNTHLRNRQTQEPRRCYWSEHSGSWGGRQCRLSWKRSERPERPRTKSSSALPLLSRSGQRGHSGPPPVPRDKENALGPCPALSGH